MWALVEERLLDEFREHPDVRERLAAAEEDVRAGRETPARAVEELFARFRGSS